MCVGVGFLKGCLGDFTVFKKVVDDQGYRKLQKLFQGYRRRVS